MSDLDDRLLVEQARYYDDRAPVYERLWFRQDGYSLGPEGDAGWFEETARVTRALHALDLSGDLLDLACGSGLWTRHLVARARSVVALDTSPRMLDLNRRRFGAGHVRYVHADAFDWTTEETFDLIVVAFFLSHVPPSRWETFWTRAASWLRARGRVWFVDDARGPDRPDPERLVGPAGHAYRRALGARSYTIVKRFWEPDELASELERLGWSASIERGSHLLFGTARPARGTDG